MPPSYPLTLDVAGRRVVVVGGGPVAARRARVAGHGQGSTCTSSRLRCVRTSPTSRRTGRVTWQRARLPHAATSTVPGSCTPRPATGPPTTSSPRDAEASHVWCVRADDALAVRGVDAGRDPRRRRDRRGHRRWRPAAGDDAARRDRRSPSTPGELPLRPHRPATHRLASPWSAAAPATRPDHDPRPPAARRGRRRAGRPAGAARAARRARPRRSSSSTSARRPGTIRCRRTRSTGCSSSTRWPDAGSCGSRAATRSCSAAAARRPWPASPPASRSRSCRASRARSPCRPPRASR